MIHRSVLTKVMILAGCGLIGVVQAATITQTLGASAGFANGSTTTSVATWNTATAGNAAPFNGFIGSDTTGPNFTASWTFSYGSFVSSITSATLALGIYDLDSAAAPHNQVSVYTENGVDLTALLNTASVALNAGLGALNKEYDILTITLPASTYADLATGNPTITLTLRGPGLGVLGPTTFNGAGIDFSTITINTATVTGTPEPASWALLLAGIGVVAGRKRFRRA